MKKILAALISLSLILSMLSGITVSAAEAPEILKLKDVEQFYANGTKSEFDQVKNSTSNVINSAFVTGDNIPDRENAVAPDGYAIKFDLIGKQWSGPELYKKNSNMADISRWTTKDPNEVCCEDENFINKAPFMSAEAWAETPVYLSAMVYLETELDAATVGTLNVSLQNGSKPSTSVHGASWAGVSSSPRVVFPVDVNKANQWQQVLVPLTQFKAAAIFDPSRVHRFTIRVNKNITETCNLYFQDIKFGVACYPYEWSTTDSYVVEETGANQGMYAVELEFNQALKADTVLPAGFTLGDVTASAVDYVDGETTATVYFDTEPEANAEQELTIDDTVLSVDELPAETATAEVTAPQRYTTAFVSGATANKAAGTASIPVYGAYGSADIAAMLALYDASGKLVDVVFSDEADDYSITRKGTTTIEITNGEAFAETVVSAKVFIIDSEANITPIAPVADVAI